MKRPTIPVVTTMASAPAVPLARRLFDWNAAWKAMTSGLMKPTNTWKSSQPLIFPSAPSRFQRLRAA